MELQLLTPIGSLPIPIPGVSKSLLKKKKKEKRLMILYDLSEKSEKYHKWIIQK